LLPELYARLVRGGGGGDALPFAAAGWEADARHAERGPSELVMARHYGVYCICLPGRWPFGSG